MSESIDYRREARQFKEHRKMKRNLENLHRYHDGKVWEHLKSLRYKLPSKLYKVLKLRNKKGQTYQEIGKEMGVTRERVRQLTEKAETEVEKLMTGK